MKLLVVSHACATPINQQFFSEVERLSGWSLTLVGPAEWTDDYGTRRPLERWPAFRGAIEPVPVWIDGNVPLHVYRSTFRRLLHRHRPDAIYVHHEPYAAATAQVYLANRAWHGCPIGFFTWQNIHKSYPPPFRQLEKMVYRGSAFACPGSESAEAVLRAKGYDGPCTLLPASINPDVHAPDPTAHRLRNDLSLAPDALVLGFMGRVSRAKGLSTTLDALAELSDVPWEFVVVGDGDHTNELRAEAEANGIASRIHFTGYVPHTDAPRYLSLFDVLLLPSETQPNWKEQFGRVLVEALACGTPLVGSDSGEIPYVIHRTGGGLSFPEGNSAALQSALRAMMDNERRQSFANTGRAYVLDQHTDAVLARRFIETVERAVSTPVPS
jgi:glycosyltransferase involved in cell wall biosynthesis